MLSIAVAMMTFLMLTTVSLISVSKMYWRSIFSLFTTMFSMKMSFFKLYSVILNDVDVVETEENEDIKRYTCDECEEIDVNNFNN